MTTKYNLKPLPQQENRYFIEVIQNRLTKLNNLVAEQRSAKTITFYERYQRSIEKYLAWFRVNNVIVDLNIDKQYVLIEIREEQEEDVFTGDKIAEKALELLADEHLGRPARDAYNMVLRIVAEIGPSNEGLTNCYVKEAVESLQKLGYI